MQRYTNSRNLVAADAGTTVIIRAKGDGNGLLGKITVMKADAHTLAFYDGVDNTGTLLFTCKASLPEMTYAIDRECTKGICCVVQAAFAGDVIVTYN